MVQSSLRFRLLLQVFYGELGFADHEHTTGAQTKNRGCTGKNRKGRGRMIKNGLAVVSPNRAAHGDKRGGGKQSKAGVKAAQGFNEELRAQVQRSELRRPHLMVLGARLERSQLRG